MVVRYQPVKISGYETGLVQDREEFLLPNDAYPKLENAYVWRERLRRKQGTELLGRLRRVFTLKVLGNLSGGTFSGNIFTATGIPKTVGMQLEPQAEIQAGSILIDEGGVVANNWTDNGDGTLSGAGGRTGTVDYNTGDLTLSGGTGALALRISFAYFPSLPVMGLRKRELNGTNVEETVAFDTKYAYKFGTQWQEFIPPPNNVTWSGTNHDFFWTTNFWTDTTTNRKLFWVTNFSGTGGDYLRYTDGQNWFTVDPTGPDVPFQINGDPIYLNQCLIILPFRGRLLALNTYEGFSLNSSINYSNRIRWAQIGNPIQPFGSGPPSTGSWRDDIRGKGGYIDLPTSEKIISAGFVRDNLVIFCETSTWQLRYTGQSISPFQYDKINTELGVESTHSSVQFDTSLVGIGDKGVVECDSFKSNRIDIKIPDFAYYIHNNNNGTKRVHGERNFQKRLAYWIYPDQDKAGTFPDKRLVYNYENDSWAIFTDSFTCLGPYQQIINRRTWSESHYTWSSQNIPWINRPSLNSEVIAGNQQGFISILDQQASNDVSLSIQAFTGSPTAPLLIQSSNHNLSNGQIIKITDIPSTSPYASELNNKRFAIQQDSTDPSNKFYLLAYNSLQQNFITPVLLDNADYSGGGKITVLDNFSIVSKKFNFMDEGKRVQLGYFDILMNATSSGSIRVNVYVDYNDDEAVNVQPQNSYQDQFFNSNIPTFTSDLHYPGSRKYWQKVFCPVFGNFITLEYTLSPEQMNGIAQESDVQIDAQILWMRQAGRIGI